MAIFHGYFDITRGYPAIGIPPFDPGAAQFLWMFSLAAVARGGHASSRTTRLKRPVEAAQGGNLLGTQAESPWTGGTSCGLSQNVTYSR